MTRKTKYIVGLLLCSSVLAVAIKVNPGQLMAMEQSNDTGESLNETTERAEQEYYLDSSSLDMSLDETTSESSVESSSSDAIETVEYPDIEEAGSESSENPATTTTIESHEKQPETNSSGLTGQVIVGQQAESAQEEKAAAFTEEMAEHFPGIAETETVEENYQFSVVKNQSTGEFIASISAFAQENAWENELYASVMISQAILETGSGSSSLSSPPNYNLFGVKGSFNGKSVSFSTQEDNGSGSLYTITASFRKYPSYKESLEDYAKLLKNGIYGNKDFYKKTWKSTTENYKDVTAFLTGRYATDTQYGSKLNALIEAYDLTQYDVKPGTKASATKKAESKTAESSTATKGKKTATSYSFEKETESTTASTTEKKEKKTYTIKSWVEEKLSIFKQPVKEIHGNQNISTPIKGVGMSPVAEDE